MVNNIIQLDFTTEGIKEKIYAVQTDTGRVLQCNIIGVDLNGVTARFYAVKESGKEIYNNCGISGNRVIIQLTEQTLAEVGIVNCQLDLRKNGEKVQSFIFNIQVTPSLMKGSSIVSSDEFKIFEELADDVAENKNKIMDLEDKKADKDQFGAPLVATVVADMTDKTRVYVYTGTEDGYVSGNWYFWDGTAWASGGVYNATAVVTDETLSMSGMAADSKIVGDKVKELKETLENNTLKDGSVTVQKLAQDVITEELTGICEKAVMLDLTDMNYFTKGKFVEDIPVADESGTEYFTDYIDGFADTTMKVNDWVSSGAASVRLYDENKTFLLMYYGAPVVGADMTAKNANAKYFVYKYDSRVTSGFIHYDKPVTFQKFNVASKEFGYYSIEEKKVVVTTTVNGEISEDILIIPGETYTIAAGTNCNVNIFTCSGIKLVGMSNWKAPEGGYNNIVITSPEKGSVMKVGYQNNGTFEITGKFVVQKTTAPDLKLIKDNFTDESFDIIAEGLGISVGKDVNETFYNCTKYGVLPRNADNTEAMQALIDLVYESGGGVIWIPVGTYIFDSVASSWDMTSNITALLEMKSGVSILGENMNGTVLKVTGNTARGAGLFCQNSVHSGEVLYGCNAENLTVDMSEASLTTYTHRGKAFYYSGIKDSVFRNLRLLETPSTSMGIDMLDNIVLDSIYVYKGGRQWQSGGAGGAGIGIGTGKWQNENYIIRNCVCDACGHFGIFLEDQGIFSPAKEKNYPKGQIITNNVVRNGRNYGIGVRGGKNVLVSGNNLYENKGGLYTDYGAKNVVFSGNLIQGSTEAGFNFGNEDETVNGGSYPCENIVVIGNTFFENAVGIKTTTEPTNSQKVNNIFISNTIDEQ